MSKRFRIAWVTQQSNHDFSQLYEMAEQVRFITNGLETEDRIQDVLYRMVYAIEPDRDLVVAAGSSNVSMLVGTTIARCLSLDWSYIMMAIYKDGKYHLMEVPIV